MVLNSLISGGCIISGGKVLSSILSPRVHIHSHAEVWNSILMDEVDVGRYACLNRVIVDKGVRIPEGCQIGFRLEEDAEKFTVSESGIVVIPKGTLLG